MTTNDVTTAIRFAALIGQAIREAGSVPAGNLYAVLQDRVSLDTFESLLRLLVREGLVRRDASHLLTWIGD